MTKFILHEYFHFWSLPWLSTLKEWPLKKFMSKWMTPGNNMIPCVGRKITSNHLGKNSSYATPCPGVSKSVLIMSYFCLQKIQGTPWQGWLPVQTNGQHKGNKLSHLLQGTSLIPVNTAKKDQSRTECVSRDQQLSSRVGGRNCTMTTQISLQPKDAGL